MDLRLSGRDVGHDTCLSVELVVSAELGVHLTPVFEVDIFDGSGIAFGDVGISCCFDVCLDVFVVELSEAFVEVLIESYRSIYYVFGELGIAGKLEVVTLIVSAAHEVAEVPELLVGDCRVVLNLSTFLVVALLSLFLQTFVGLVNCLDIAYMLVCIGCRLGVADRSLVLDDCLEVFVLLGELVDDVYHLSLSDVLYVLHYYTFFHFRRMLLTELIT